MLIHEAAAITGLTIDAIRYYERQHLLDERHITRQLNGYRSFTSCGNPTVAPSQARTCAGLYCGGTQKHDKGV